MNQHFCSVVDFRSYIKANPNILIGTLGPVGTSCDHTINFLLDGLDTQGQCKVLINHFDDIYHSLLDGNVDIAMIPAAYSDVTRFFWSTELYIIGSVIYKTPDYHFTRASGATNISRIATCTAVKHMLEKQFLHCLNAPYEVIIGPSTLAASKEVMKGNADACITNDGGLKGTDLEVMHTQKGVDMSWLFFRKQPSTKFS